MSEEESISCPICGTGRLTVKSMLYSVPFFNELAMFTMKCDTCNFTHNDVFSPEDRPPCRWSLHVDNERLLRVRVVRSSSGTIRIPDFGIDVEPGPGADSFISNVEGVLFRTRPVVETAIRFAEKPEEKARGREVVEMIDRALAGDLHFTLVVEDPVGVSGILPDDMSLVEYQELTHEEASKLRGAPGWLDTARDEYAERKG
ncbi:ZPR1 zinc finger domain-containing protein [Candidatus Thorarchaeota archaeon]|nr:MAG: ZPR1 zinc finger domain-containing protein [Candidatus Thorarchaeota archaeon]